MAQQAEAQRQEQRARYVRTDVWMLAIIMGSLASVFLGGTGILVATDFLSADIVSILSAPLAVIGTVAAGVFGYSLGARGTAEAQQTATTTAREAARVREVAAPLAQSVKRIVTQARSGGTFEGSGKFLLSEDDLQTMFASAEGIA